MEHTNLSHWACGDLVTGLWETASTIRPYHLLFSQNKAVRDGGVARTVWQPTSCGLYWHSDQGARVRGARVMASSFEHTPTNELLIMLWIVIGQPSHIEQYVHVKEAILELAT